MEKPCTHYEYEEAKATVAAQLSGNVPEGNAAGDMLAAEFDSAMQTISEYEQWFSEHFKVNFKKGGES